MLIWSLLIRRKQRYTATASSKADCIKTWRLSMRSLPKSRKRSNLTLRASKTQMVYWQDRNLPTWTALSCRRRSSKFCFKKMRHIGQKTSMLRGTVSTRLRSRYRRPNCIIRKHLRQFCHSSASLLRSHRRDIRWRSCQCGDFRRLQTIMTLNGQHKLCLSRWNQT